MPVHNFNFPRNEQSSPQDFMRHAGAVLNFTISVPSAIASFLQKNQKDVPSPVSKLALIDTGASISAVDESILKGLGLLPVDQTLILTPSGRAEQFIYSTLLEFPGTPIPPLEMRVVGADLVAQDYSGLIGRDILSHCLFIMNGPGGSFSLSF